MMVLNSVVSTLLLSVSGAFAALGTLQQFTGDFGPNPTGVGFFYYTPAQLASPPPLIVAMHYCTGDAQDYFEGTQYANLADTHGFIVIYPSAPAVGTCFDVASNATLTHNAGGDSLGIASWRVTPLPTGVVLMGAYPDIFAAGSLFSGVPYGCFAGPNAWNTQCALGELILTPQQWGDLVRSGYPGFTGTRPKVQFWHGTADTTLYPQNFWEEIKQWTNVFGVSQTPSSNLTNDPLPGYSRASFGPDVQGILAQGVGHTVPVREGDVLDWFSLSNLTATPSPITSTLPPTSTTVAGHWDQCGGIGFTGPTGTFPIALEHGGPLTLLLL
ncbi:hypothetical protein NM688_g4904 [Phlebia brevispora]|uniref:Uncharacterized protein n=1 Tax=Phlebia brevispora TaxID=194682 RepID=A0ACC1T1V6_9APHY|nr:hypothetical protein NM688_g4904 [Phlebia brevispora]